MTAKLFQLIGVVFIVAGVAVFAVVTEIAAIAIVGGAILISLGEVGVYVERQWKEAKKQTAILERIAEQLAPAPAETMPEPRREAGSRRL